MKKEFRIEKIKNVFAKRNITVEVVKFSSTEWRFVHLKTGCFIKFKTLTELLNWYEEYVEVSKNADCDFDNAVHLAMLEMIPVSAPVYQIGDSWTNEMWKCKTWKEFNEVVKRGIKENWIY